MSELNKPQQAVEKREPVSVEYVPYGAQDKVKLSVSIVQNLVAVKTKSGKTCSDRDALKFLAMCQAKRMNPFEGDCFLIGYDGREGPQFALVTAHQTYLKRAELHPEFDGMKSGVIVREDGALKEVEGDFMDEGQELLGGWATVFFKSRKYPMHKRLNLSRFQKAWGVWQENPAGMIVKCSEADALRSAFPTMLGGLYLREEMPELSLPVVKPDFGPSKPLFNGTQAPAISDRDDGVLFAANPKPETVGKAAPTPEFDHVIETPPTTMPEGIEKKLVAPTDTSPQTSPQPGFHEFPKGNGFNPVKAVRGLCRMAKIKEAELLEKLSADGTTDGSASTLEEVMLQPNGPAILKSVSENWPDIVARFGEKGGE